MEPEEMKEDEVMEEEETEEVEPSVAVMEAVTECFEDGGAAYGKTKNEAIDAVVAKLEGMKDEGEAMGGLGMDEGPMDLGEAEA